MSAAVLSPADVYEERKRRTSAETYTQSQPTSRQITSFPSYTPPLLSRLPTTLLATPYSQPQLAFDEKAVGYTISELPSIDPASLALHYALYRFRAISDAYATLPYHQAFNWQDITLPEEIQREWYIVAFRSTRRKDADSDKLYQADRDAHEEAVTAGGLLLYWYGSINGAGENLATCIWQSRKDAIAANRNPKHAIAARLASTTYERYVLERYVLRKVKGETGIRVEEWQGGDVGF